MSRPRTSDERRVATAVRLPESIHRRLHSAAAERDVSANLLVTRAVADFLENLAPVESVLNHATDGHRSVETRSDHDSVAGART